MVYLYYLQPLKPRPLTATVKYAIRPNSGSVERMVKAVNWQQMIVDDMLCPYID